ncbi:MAG: hypothetical protein Q4F21_01420, partial [Lachnospiraceae bacterium]|nr:hypothetical protein [Lachnospiraceae bacterium]
IRRFTCLRRDFIHLKTKEHYDKILSFMEPGRWYKANELTEILEVKETRTKMLLRALVADKKLEDNGVTKGKAYRKADKI